MAVPLDRNQEADMSFLNSHNATVSSQCGLNDMALNEQLVEFFRRLENGYKDAVMNSTLKLNLNLGNTSLSLYGVPSKDGYGKGEIFL